MSRIPSSSMSFQAVPDTQAHKFVTLRSKQL